METRKNLLSEEFSNSFGCWFNSDLIEIDNHAENISLADAVVTDLMKKGISSQEIIAPLKYALAHWSPEIVDEFSRASDGDWSFDNATQALLKDIVHKMVAVALRS